MRRKVTISVADGFHLRYFQQFDLLTIIASEFEVTLVAPGYLIPYLPENIRLSCRVIPLKIVKFTLLERNLLRLIRSGSEKNFETIRVKQSASPLKYLVRSILLKILNFIGQVHFNRLLAILLSQRFEHVQSQLHDSNLFILSTPAQKPMDVVLSSIAFRNKIKVLSTVYSWDNLTGKGPLYFKPEHLLVWNQIMKKEATELHGYKEEDVTICGNPLFIALRKSAELYGSGAESFRNKLGICKDLKIITLHTVPQAHYGEGFRELVKKLKVCIKDSAIDSHFVMVIRPHPFDDTNYNDLCDDKTFIDNSNAKISLGREAWIPDTDQVNDLRMCLMSSDINLSVASTILLDASILNVNCYPLGFNLDKNFQIPTMNLYKYAHMKKLIKIGEYRVVEDFEILMEILRRNIVAEPNYHMIEQNYFQLKEVKVYLGSKMAIIRKMVND